MKDLEVTNLFKLSVGDCEGNHKKFLRYIELKSEEYFKDPCNGYQLTDLGHTRFAKKEIPGWDPKYFNYSLELMSLADARNDKRLLQDEFYKIRERLRILKKYC